MVFIHGAKLTAGAVHACKMSRHQQANTTFTVTAITVAVTFTAAAAAAAANTTLVSSTRPKPTPLKARRSVGRHLPVSANIHPGVDDGLEAIYR